MVVLYNHYQHQFVDLELYICFLILSKTMMIKCKNSLLEKKAAAVDLIKMRLSETPNDPRLWYVDCMIFCIFKVFYPTCLCL